MLHADTDTSGPIFNGQAPAIMEAYCREAETDVARHAYHLVRAELDTVLRNPTGYYESQVEVRSERGDAVVTDGGIVYGPWLEGVGERNRSTRFKGYFTFRRVAQRISGMSGSIAERTLPKYLRRLDG